MAGGSADAAAALIACAQLWGTSTSRADLAGMAAELGSDVAFGLTGGTALGTGRGEVALPRADHRHPALGAGLLRRGHLGR